MSMINELEKLVAKASDKAADLEVYAKDHEYDACWIC